MEPSTSHEKNKEIEEKIEESSIDDQSESDFTSSTSVTPEPSIPR